MDTDEDTHDARHQLLLAVMAAVDYIEALERRVRELEGELRAMAESDGIRERDDAEVHVAELSDRVAELERAVKTWQGIAHAEEVKHQASLRACEARVAELEARSS